MKAWFDLDGPVAMVLVIVFWATAIMMLVVVLVVFLE
jgi:hypothetical protein